MEIEKYAVVDTEREKICYHDDGAAITNTKEDAERELTVVADLMGWNEDRLKVMNFLLTEEN